MTIGPPRKRRLLTISPHDIVTKDQTMTTTTILRTRAAASAGINHLCQLENGIAQVYADIRHRLGPGAPARLFELEGAHRNRATRLEQRMREHLIYPVPTKGGLSTIAGLTLRLEQQHDVGEIFVLLRELERELLAAYESYDDAAVTTDDANDVLHAPWLAIAVLSDQRESLAAIEEELTRPRQAPGPTVLPHDGYHPLA